VKFAVCIRGRERGSRLREAKQPLTWCRDSGFFNEAGNVIETHKRGVGRDEARVLSEANETYAAEAH
jgi:hypothetical protein